MNRLIVWLLCAMAGAADPPNVLVLMSYHRGMPWEDGVASGMQEALAGKAELVYVHYDIKRFPGRERVPALLARTRDVAVLAQPVLVIVMDDYAWDLALEHRQELFPDLPIVFGGVNFWDGKFRPPHTTGVVEGADPGSTVELAFRLHPGTTRLVVVNDETETGKANHERLVQELPRVIGERRIEWLGKGTFAETEAALAALDPACDVVLIMSWNLDAAGAVRSYAQAAERVRAVCPAPIYAVWDLYYDKRIIGGYLLDAHTHGLRTGALAARVLAGEAPASIPVDTRPSTRLVLDHRELERFAVDPALIPSGAVILHRPAESFWHQYGITVAVITAIILLQAATIASLLVAMRRRRRAEAAVREGEERLRRLAENSRDIVYRLDLAGGRYQFLNPAYERITGWSVAEAMAEPWFMRRVIPADRHPWLDQQLAAIRRGEVADRYEFPIICRDGGIRWLEQRDCLVRDRDGRPIALEGVVRDVTEARDTEARLRQSQRMDAIGQLASGVAHDFNNVLTAVLGHADLLMLRLGANPEMRSHAEIIAGAAQRAAGTVRNLLAFARGRRDTGGTCDLDRMVRDSVALLTHAIDKRIIVACATGGSGHVRMGADELQQVLVNLALNARDAMPEGGRIGFSTRREELDAGAATALGLGPGTYARLEVADTGHGIASEHLERVFEPFFTTKALGKGSGLGLSVVHGAVRGAGGAIRIDSAPGRGAVFRIWLPATPTPSQERTPVPPTTNGLRTLLVDDEPVVLAAVGGLLEAAGCVVRSFADPEAAAGWFTGNPDAADIAVIDGNMPGMAGWELASRLLACRGDLPIVALTGAATPEAMDAWRLAGVGRVLAKPVTHDTLAAVLGEVRRGTVRIRIREG